MGEVVSFDDAVTRRRHERLSAYAEEFLGFLSWGADEFDLDRPDAVFAVMLECVLELEGAHEAGFDVATELLEWFRDRIVDSLDAQAD